MTIEERAPETTRAAARCSSLLAAALLLSACALRDRGTVPIVHPGPDLPPAVGEREESGSGSALSLPDRARDPAQPDVVEIDRLVRLAGRAPLFGLPAVRARTREEESQRALERLGEELRRRTADEAWTERLVRIVDGPPGRRDDLWCAAVRALGRLGRYEFVPAFVRAIEAEEGAKATGTSTSLALRGEAARQALHDLYGRWFRSAAEVAPFARVVLPSEATELLLSESLRVEETARARLEALLAHEPERAPDWLADPDPLVRAAAARVLGDSMVGARPARDGVFEALLARVPLEPDPRAHQAVVEALSRPLEGRVPDAPEVARLRSLLMTAPVDERALATARALARLPWRTSGPEDEAHMVSGMRALGALLDGLSAESYTDPDPILEALLSLETLAEHALKAGLAESLKHNPAREPIFRLAGDSSRSEVVRVAAAASLGAFALAEDGPVVLEILRRDASAALRHALLGALRSILLDVRSDMPGTPEVLAAVADLAGADDPDLRRRALSLLADPALAELVETMPPDYLVKRFAREEVPDLSRRVVALLTAFGRPSMLDAVLAARRFEELAADPTGLPELGTLCTRLVAGDAARAMRAARALAGIATGDVHPTRTRRALSLVEALAPEEAAGLSGEEHRTICAWTWRLHAAGGEILRPTKELLPFVRRLVDLHWPRSAPGTGQPGAEAGAGLEFDEAARAHLHAVALGVLRRAQDPGRTTEGAEQAFERALRVAPSHVGRHGVDLAVLVRRDRARFRAGVGEEVKALADFRALFEASALELRDLRRTIELLESVASQGDGRVIARERLALTLAILEQPDWRSEPASLRLADLARLQESALAAGDEASVRGFLALLAELPSERPDPSTAAPSPPAGTGPIWADLARAPEGWDLLTKLRDAAERTVTPATE